MTDTFLLEPELIATQENVMPDANTDLILAKNFMKQQSAATGDTLYDHLVDLVQKILTTKPPDVVDKFEAYSWAVKLEKFRPNFDLLSDLYMSPPQLAVVRRVDEMIRVIESKTNKAEMMGEEEEVNPEEEEGARGKVVDLLDHNYYFKEGGYGLPQQECYAVYLALMMLSMIEPVANVRFFGKIFGTEANYYVAETDLTEEGLDSRIRLNVHCWTKASPKDLHNDMSCAARIQAPPATLTRVVGPPEFEMRDMPGEGGEEEAHEEEEKEASAGDLGEGEHVEVKPTEPQRPTMPDPPQSTWQPPPVVPVERPGQGVNKKVYYVCNKPGEVWEGLPDVTPDQIRVARLSCRACTGRLNSEVLVFPPFDGCERNYLRAQIARIQASTSISPQGFYTFGSGEEEDIDMEEGMGDMAFNINPYYQGHMLKDLLNPNLTIWVHHGRHILKQGRTLWWNPTAGLDEDIEEEDEDAPPPAIPETGPSLFSPLSEDTRMDGLPMWIPRLSSVLCPERALVTMRSTLWPGAVAYATNTKKSECMYVGWGLKYLPPNFSPLQLPRPQQEWVVGPEVMEMADPTFADEEAYRIAHLPPPPPEIPGEGEGFGEEEEVD